MSNETQATFDSFATDTAAEETPTETPDTGTDARPAGYDGRPLDPDRGCPWCLAPPETFTDAPVTGTACGVCEANQPTHMDWYQNGEKIVALSDAARMYQGDSP